VTIEQTITPAVKAGIEEAIRTAELGTSAEVRVHLEDHCPGEVLDRAAFIFAQLEMHKTALRNGVLIYVALADKKIAVIGDAGIHTRIEKNTWEEIKSGMIAHLKQENFLAGITAGVHMVGEIIKRYFPISADDKNELSNELTTGHPPTNTNR
jgi:uncharacterized membrane protein